MAETKTPVAWCRTCLHYLPVEDVGQQCPGGCGKRLTRRTGYIDERSETQEIYWDIHEWRSICAQYDTTEEAQERVLRLAAETVACHCWHVIDRNEGRTETVRQGTESDCPDCQGSGTVPRWKALRRECGCGMNPDGQSHTACGKCTVHWLKDEPIHQEDCDCQGRGWLPVTVQEAACIGMDLSEFLFVKQQDRHGTCVAWFEDVKGPSVKDWRHAVLAAWEKWAIKEETDAET